MKPGPVEFVGLRWLQVSQLAKDLIALLLEKDPARRIHAHEVLKHPWIAKFAPSLTPRARQAPPSAYESSASAGASTSGAAGAASAAASCAVHKQHALLVRIPRSEDGLAAAFDSAHGFGADRSVASGRGQTAAGGSAPGSRSAGGSQRCTGEQVASARVFASPEDIRVRVALHTFTDAFKTRVEGPHTELMRAAGPDAAAAAWDKVGGRLKEGRGAFCGGEGPFGVAGLMGNTIRPRGRNFVWGGRELMKAAWPDAVAAAWGKVGLPRGGGTIQMPPRIFESRKCDIRYRGRGGVTCFPEFGLLHSNVP